MAGKLTAKSVAAIKDPGRYGDGDELWLIVSKTGARRWACPCGRHALVAGTVHGRAPKYCSEPCRDKFSRKPAIKAWVRTRAAKRAAERA
jgi:hypothetical protein